MSLWSAISPDRGSLLDLSVRWKARGPARVHCPHFTTSCPQDSFFSSIFESPWRIPEAPYLSVKAETGLSKEHCTKLALSMLCLSDSRFIICDIQKGPHDSPNSIPLLQREGHGDCSSPWGWLMGEPELETRLPDSTRIYLDYARTLTFTHSFH